MFKVGKIVNTHGIRGEVKVLRITDFAERFTRGNSLYIANAEGSLIKVTIDGHRMHKGFDLLHFSGYDNINDVEGFKGAFLKIDDSQLTELADGEFYYHEIIGCKVFSLTTKEELGVIKEILSPGANDVWVIKQKAGKDLLIPYIPDVVKDIDVDQKRIMIEPMEGLLD